MKSAPLPGPAMPNAAFPVLLLAMLLAACGGSKSSSSSASSAPASAPADTSGQRSAQIATDQRTVPAPCAFTQNIGAARGDGLRIAAVSWLQTSALDAGSDDTRLMAGKAVLARVDILSDNGASAPPTRDLLVYDSASQRCERIVLNGPARTPTAIDPLTLNTAYTATIPARLIQPGLALSLVLDDSGGRSTDEADQTWRLFTPEVAPATTEMLRIIPLRHRLVDGYVQSPASLAALLVRLHPLTAVTTRVEPAFTPPALTGSGGEASYLTMQRVLDEVDDECARLNDGQTSAGTAPKCLGVFPDNIVFRPAGDPRGRVVGIAYVGGSTMLAESVAAVDDSTVGSPYAERHWLAFRALTVAHEMGHLLNLDHGNCGDATGLDPRLYADGRLGGGAGHDSARGFYFSGLRPGGDGQPQFGDLMSYCSKEWTSDRGYLAAMAYRTPPVGTRARQQAEAGSEPRWLKISRTATGWKLRRVSFAPASLQASDLSLLVLDAQGSERLPLAQAVIADAAGSVLGPYYINLGNRQVSGMKLMRAGELVQDLLPGGLKAP